MSPAISVVLPVYNAEACICEQLSDRKNSIE